MDILSKLKAGTSNTKEIKWPGTEIFILLRVLNDQDYLESTLAADVLFKDTKIGVENLTAYSSEKTTQLLFRAILDPETKEPLFKRIIDLRKVLSPEIKEILTDELDQLHDECSPNPLDISDNEFDKLLSDCKKKSEVTVGNISNINTLRKLVVCLANQEIKSLTDNGSTS